MKDILDAKQLDLIQNRDLYLQKVKEYHKNVFDLMRDPKTGFLDRPHFNSLIPTMITRNFVMLFADDTKEIAIVKIQKHFESLIPEVDDYEKVPERDPVSNAPLTDKNGKIKMTYKRGADNKPIPAKVKLYDLGPALTTIANKVEEVYYTQSIYWDARAFVMEHTKKIDERMFDKMNDYLWRNIMAVRYPESIKREFKHLCINIKRKLFYLGDRDEVHNQTMFGLFSSDGGTGKTSLLAAFSDAFSNGRPAKISKLTHLLDFNKDTADKYGVLFFDEDAKGEKPGSQDLVKSLIDSEERTVEAKGVDSYKIPNILTLVVSGNHRLATRMFEDEARGQRRDSTFEVIGLVQQYTESEMRTWFDKMFDVCPFDDDFKTYKHVNPHSNEINDRERAVLERILERVTTEKQYGLWGLADAIDVRKTSSPDLWYGLKGLLKMKHLFTPSKNFKGHNAFTPNLTAIRDALQTNQEGEGGERPVEPPFDWTINFRDSRPWISAAKVIKELESNENYDDKAPITYAEHFNANTCKEV